MQMTLVSLTSFLIIEQINDLHFISITTHSTFIIYACVYACICMCVHILCMDGELKVPCPLNLSWYARINPIIVVVLNSAQPQPPSPIETTEKNGLFILSLSWDEFRFTSAVSRVQQIDFLYGFHLIVVFGVPFHSPLDDLLWFIGN